MSYERQLETFTNKKEKQLFGYFQKATDISEFLVISEWISQKGCFYNVLYI